MQVGLMHSPNSLTSHTSIIKWCMFSTLMKGVECLQPLLLQCSCWRHPVMKRVKLHPVNLVGISAVKKNEPPPLPRPLLHPQSQRKKMSAKLIKGLAHQDRTIAIASDFRIDGAKSPEILQKKGFWAPKSQPEIANR